MKKYFWLLTIVAFLGLSLSNEASARGRCKKTCHKTQSHCAKKDYHHGKHHIKPTCHKPAPKHCRPAKRKHC